MADVLVEPAQGLNLVQQAVVSLSGLITGTEEACECGVRKIYVGKKRGGHFREDGRGVKETETEGE